ncbi:MAG: hypothetical protein NWQ28_01230 [Nodularia sp. (in: cyanobacteria)]|nr:hypothetical protein [Nodularia sp. (in: cyanobacteria)]
MRSHRLVCDRTYLFFEPLLQISSRDRADFWEISNFDGITNTSN